MKCRGILTSLVAGTLLLAIGCSNQQSPTSTDSNNDGGVLSFASEEEIIEHLVATAPHPLPLDSAAPMNVDFDEHSSVAAKTSSVLFTWDKSVVLWRLTQPTTDLAVSEQKKFLYWAFNVWGAYARDISFREASPYESPDIEFSFVYPDTLKPLTGFGKIEFEPNTRFFQHVHYELYEQYLEGPSTVKNKDWAPNAWYPYELYRKFLGMVGEAIGLPRLTTDPNSIYKMWSLKILPQSTDLANLYSAYGDSRRNPLLVFELSNYNAHFYVTNEGSAQSLYKAGYEWEGVGGAVDRYASTGTIPLYCNITISSNMPNSSFRLSNSTSSTYAHLGYTRSSYITNYTPLYERGASHNNYLYAFGTSSMYHDNEWFIYTGNNVGYISR